MNGYATCANGHFYKSDLSDCPYCPAALKSKGTKQPVSDLDKTHLETGERTSIDLSKTEITGAGFQAERTQFITGNGVSNASLSQSKLDRTQITGAGQPKQPAFSASNAMTEKRKMVGWLVSYSHDPFGMDYKIYEGNNSVGRDVQNTVRILQDTSISGKHVTILAKKGQFYIKDEMTPNGTFLNAEELEVERAYSLKDNDVIQIGETSFKFKSSI